MSTNSVGRAASGRVGARYLPTRRTSRRLPEATEIDVQVPGSGTSSTHALCPTRAAASSQISPCGVQPAAGSPIVPGSQ